MNDQRELRGQIQRIAALVKEIEQTGDPAVRTKTQELARLFMELHGAGLERMLEVIFRAGETGVQVIDELGRDPLVGALLVLYGIHPEDTERRVRSAVERVRPKVRFQGGEELQVLGIEGGQVRLRVKPAEHVCASTSKSLQSTIEDAIYEAAPDIAGLSIEGLEDKPASGFVPLDKLMASATAAPARRHLPAVQEHAGTD